MTSNSRGGDSRRSSRRDNARHEPLEEIVESSGNVFLDLGSPPAEAENLLLRSTLMIEVKRLIRRRKLTQAKAAKLLGVTQPRISDLTRGKIGVFSIDMLLKMLTRAGVKFELKLKPRAA